MEANGLTPEQAEIDDEGFRRIVRDYTREAGVRNLEREIGKALRHAAVRIAEGSAEQVRIGADDLPAIIGPPQFENEVAMRTSVPGVATGLAWTPVGGDILFIEATRTPGKGSLILTGQLGDVMRESAQAALSLVKNRAAALGLDEGLFEKNDIHIHVPAGATPKDGPSAGVAIYTALVSLLTGRTVRNDTAMTGEISLRGLVLPVGGIKEKVVAAARAGLPASCCRPATARMMRTSPRTRATSWSSSGWSGSTTRSQRRWRTRRRSLPLPNKVPLCAKPVVFDSSLCAKRFRVA